jgi:hypothetical protein
MDDEGKPPAKGVPDWSAEGRARGAGEMRARMGPKIIPCPLGETPGENPEALSQATIDRMDQLLWAAVRHPTPVETAAKEARRLKEEEAARQAEKIRLDNLPRVRVAPPPRSEPEPELPSEDPPAGPATTPVQMPAPPSAKARRGAPVEHDWARIHVVLDFLRFEHESLGEGPLILRAVTENIVRRVQKWCTKETGRAPHEKTIKQRMRDLRSK